MSWGVCVRLGVCFRVGVWRFVGVKVFFVGWRDEFVAVV